MESEDVPTKVLAVVSELLVPRVLRRTHPLFALTSRKGAELLGSGVVIGAGIVRYVLTASHLVNQVGSSGLMIGLGDEMLEVRGKRWCVTTANAVSGTDSDRIDVTVIRLDEDAAGHYPEDAVTPVAALEIDPAPDIRNPLLLLGYPCSKHKRALREHTFEAKAYSVVVDEVDLVEYATLTTDRSAHLALSLDRKDVWLPGGQRTAPSLNGMSGSGVWRMSVYGDGPASSVRLAGLFVEHYQKSRIKHVIATRLTPVLAVVAGADMELRGALAEIGVHVA